MSEANAPAQAGDTRPSATLDEGDLGRWLARGLPVVTLVGAVVVGIMTSLGPALLVVAGGALLGVIAFFWASLRTLGGESRLPRDLVVHARVAALDDIAERKKAVLRALKDLEHEHAVGKIDDEDFAELTAYYRAEAKAILREMDDVVGPVMTKAEALAQAHLAKVGLAGGDAPGAPSEASNAPSEPSAAASDASAPSGEPSGEASSEPSEEATPGEAPSDRDESRVVCSACGVSNEPDAAFCKKCGAKLRSTLAEAHDAAS
jgi:ribosomal protein L40E